MSGYNFRDLLREADRLREDTLAGLSASPKYLLPKYFYDGEGCALFEAICQLPEYYPTRTELAIMRTHAAAMARELGDQCSLIEIGCGNSEKTRLLLDALKATEFIAIDIALEQLRASCELLRQRFPKMAVVAIRADFTHDVTLPSDLMRDARRRVLYFPGSTIGNFTRDEAGAFLARWARQLGRGGGALIGVDLKKDPMVVHAAYNDAQGVTARFNLNLLARLNRELGADFNLRSFSHRAFYDGNTGRVEMHLESLREQKVHLAGHEFVFGAGETIHTENSCKYSMEEFQKLAREAGFIPVRCWTDAANLFSMHYLELQ